MLFAGVVEDVFEGLFAIGVAHPRSGNQFGSESYKPGVEVVLARTRLAGDRAISKLGFLRYTFSDVSYHDPRSFLGYVLGYYLLAFRMLGRHVEHLLIVVVLVAYYLGDRCRFHPASAVRDRRGGRCYVQRGDLVRAEYDGRPGMFGETRGDPASPCDVRDLLWSVLQATASGVHRQVREHHDIRLPERLLKADLTPLDAIVVLYLPRLLFVEADLALFFLRDVAGIGIDSLLQGCDEGKRLERTARLALALGDEIELGVLVPVADHGLYPACLRLYGDEGEVGVVRVGEVPRGPVGDLVCGDLLL